MKKLFSENFSLVEDTCLKGRKLSPYYFIWVLQESKIVDVLCM